jgi:hypothetical protein
VRVADYANIHARSKLFRRHNEASWPTVVWENGIRPSSGRTKIRSATGAAIHYVAVC